MGTCCTLNSVLFSIVPSVCQYDPVEFLGETRGQPARQNSHLHFALWVSLQYIHLDR